MDTERENLRQLFLDFIDTQPDDEWDDTDAWKRYLQTYDDLLAEVEQLQKELEESKENFSKFECGVEGCTNEAMYMDIICEKCKSREDEYFANLHPSILRG